MIDKIFQSIGTMPIFAIVTLIFIVFRMFPPKKVNALYGYRTKRSMKNQINWDFAQKSSSNISLFFTAIIFFFQILLSFMLENIEYLNIALLILWFICLIVMFIYVERKLKRLN
jgi:uncharacterized membrane protein